MKDLFTSECVSKGHPDKCADQISDAVVDACLREDTESRVACETLVTRNKVILSGEITTKAKPKYQEIIRDTVRGIGYDIEGFNWKDLSTACFIQEQSPDISQGVTEGEGLFKEQGAGDQGMMFGYACNDTPDLMPAPIHYARKILEGLNEHREKHDWLMPDAKSQVTFEYEDGKPVRVPTVVVSTMHKEEVQRKTIESLVFEVIEEVLPEEYPTEVYLINPTGQFVVGGPAGDTGLTGRKIIVDTYGGKGSHGGGAFSGKDPSKVDRSAAYAARYAAKNMVAAGIASKCEVQFAYAIGVADPVSVRVDTFGTSPVDDIMLADIVRGKFPIKPAEIIERFDLKRPIYLNTARYGHFGFPGTSDRPWEDLDVAEKL